MAQTALCDSCGEVRTMSSMWEGICVQCAPGYAKEVQDRIDKNNERIDTDPRPSRVRTTPTFNQAEYQRDYYLRTKYGLTLDQYNEILVLQEGVCAICGNPEHSLDRRGFTKPLFVDHDHDTKKVRGLLCSKCNTALGYFEQDITRIQIAIQYLEDPPGRRVL